MNEPDPIAFPINGELDLHTFRPSDVGELIPDYIEACRQRGIADLRIVHGKGTGTLRETVHAILRRHPAVEGFRLGDAASGSWGATLVKIKITES